LRVQHSPNRGRERFPARALAHQLPLSGGGEAVLLHPLMVLAGFPIAPNPARALQPVQCRVERAGFHRQHIAGVQADGLADSIAMLGSPLQGLEDEQVQRALQQLNPVLVTRLHGLFSLDSPCSGWLARVYVAYTLSM